MRGDGETALTTRVGQGDGLEDGDPPGSPGDAGPLAGELAAIDRPLDRSTRIVAGGAGVAKPFRDPLIYDPDGEEGERLEAWRQTATEVRSYSPVLAAALLWDAWETEPPLARQAWLGPLLVSATLRERRKTRAHLLGVNSALRLVRRDQRRSPEQAVRLNAFVDAIQAGAEAGMKDHDRWLLARRSLEVKLTGRRSSSKLPALVELILARPIASAGMIAAALGVTPRAAQAMHGCRAWPPRDDRARPLPGLGTIVSLFFWCEQPRRCCRGTIFAASPGGRVAGAIPPFPTSA